MLLVARYGGEHPAISWNVAIDVGGGRAFWRHREKQLPSHETLPSLVLPATRERLWAVGSVAGDVEQRSRSDLGGRGVSQTRGAAVGDRRDGVPNLGQYFFCVWCFCDSAGSNNNFCPQVDKDNDNDQSSSLISVRKVVTCPEPRPISCSASPSHHARRSVPVSPDAGFESLSSALFFGLGSVFDSLGEHGQRPHRSSTRHTRVKSPHICVQKSLVPELPTHERDACELLGSRSVCLGRSVSCANPLLSRSRAQIPSSSFRAEAHTPLPFVFPCVLRLRAIQLRHTARESTLSPNSAQLRTATGQVRALSKAGAARGHCWRRGNEIGWKTNWS